MDSFPILYTDRLQLRKIQIEDVPSLVKYANNRKISDYIINIPYPYREPDAVFRISYVVQGFKKKERFVFAITLKESEEFIGEISLHLDKTKPVAELGYWVAEPYWNQGLGTEAIATILKFGFKKLNLDTVFATCHVENISSGKVVQKNGMSQRSLRGNIILYDLSKQTYEEQQNSTH